MDVSTRTAVAEATCRASHRRDHGHTVLSPECHPHTVEVVHLGDRAFAICHDCCADSGFMSERDAQRTADDHRTQTAVRSVPLPRTATA